MIERFIGPNGTTTLKDAVLQQLVVQHDDAIAGQVIAVGTLNEHQIGDVLMEQARADEGVFFILAGEVNVEVNGRTIGSRKATETVGEMAAVDPTAPRSATIRAAAETVTLRIGSGEFIKIADEHPKIWRAVARVIADRLRQRHRFHRPPNAKPIMFVGSSVEGLEVAKHIQLGMKHDPVEVRIWTNGVFGPSCIPIQTLLQQMDECDFAIFVFGPDDRVASRDDKYQAPRDNVIFEMGLFLARLGLDRTFMVKEQNADLKIPSDLLGITPLTYVADRKAKMEVIIGPVSTELGKKIRELGSV